MEDAEWVDEIKDHERYQRQRTRVRRNVEQVAEYVQKQVDAPDDGEETGNLHHISVLSINQSIMIAISSV